MRFESQWREVERRSRSHSDYDQLRKCGSISVRVEDARAWREHIRERARVDRVSIRTGISGEGTVAWALMRFAAPGRAEVRQRMVEQEDLRAVTRVAASRSSELGHTLDEWHREPVEHRAISACRACGARVYVELVGSLDVVEGAAVEERCPERPAI